MGKIYYVSVHGDDKNNGSEYSPFATISYAANIARAGDTVIVSGGVYRECVSPAYGGGSNASRITYKSADGERAVIKGSEIIDNWQKYGTLWKSEIDNTLFGNFNPFACAIDGDWLMSPVEPFLHTGAVYSDGAPLKEAVSLDKLTNWSYYAEVTDDKTIIYADFGASSPNDTLTEINVRQSCFYPQKTGINYITVSGFEFAHSASPWAPPTAEQIGMVGTHWSKGWIIENNILHDARCSAVSIGKEISTGHNPYTEYHRKSGYQYQLETVFNALKIGWSKDTVGSHIIRNNIIYDCGQNGIVGNLGCIFSEIYGNHIYNIGNKREFFGYEIAGIKLHAAIDVQIHHNVIHDCFWGTWLDWQAQGARLSSNIYFNNDKDLWIEVTHGPFLADNNIFGSQNNITNNAQGSAYVNNLFCGRTQFYDVRNRSTPYHIPHSTAVQGCALVYGGDNRYYNNIFCGSTDDSSDIRHKWYAGTDFYNGYTASLDEYIDKVMSHGRGDIETFECEKQPIYIDRNCYLDNAGAFQAENTKIDASESSEASIKLKDNTIYLEITLPKEFEDFTPFTANTDTLGTPRISEAPFENPDGSPIEIKSERIGPDIGLKSGKNKIAIELPLKHIHL